MANGVPQNVTVSSTEEQVTITGLHPGEYYTFTIIAINDICPSLSSVQATVRTMEEGTYVMMTILYDAIQCVDMFYVITVAMMLFLLYSCVSSWSCSSSIHSA